jgi:hypothetical protein
MKRILARFSRWLLNLCEPPKPRIAGPDLFAVCTHSSLHGAPPEVHECGGLDSLGRLKEQAIVRHNARKFEHKTVRVVRYEPVSEWMPGDGP